MAIAADGMQKDVLKLKAVSQNLANAITPGYKKQLLVTQAFALQMEQGLAAAPSSPVSSSFVIDPAAGTLRPTGNPHDIAIEGDAYLELAAPEGLRYTRQGGLRVDARGRLVGSQGLPVLGMGGEIVLAGEDFRIESNGEVWQRGAVVGQLKLARFENPGALEPAGGGMYVQGAARALDVAGMARVRIAHQENSNVNSAQEMVALTETVRHFEALAKVIQGYDDNLEKTIRKLGEF
ncbi:flagellar hook-basal body protein [Massilia sp. YIM B04103]|uniref:flagellar hook-basal body protein n=1 Tax=Massilia sp. YIM B04103 TaxID=2963106 RepID=UPI002108A361|nr:flagellar hook basal-body protein [Massilia sp. YIM B04103]